MAFQNFWFPSQTGSYYTKAGNIRINIKYDDGTAADNIDVNCPLADLSSLDMPLEISPSGQNFRFNALSFTFINIPYDATNNKFEQYSILNETYSKQIFVDFYLDGSIYWHGIVDFDKIKRTDYYIDGANLKYRRIKIKCYDRLAYFWFNDHDLSDASYADSMTIYDLINNIFSDIDISSGDMVYHSEIAVVEPCGNEYRINATGLRLYGISSSRLTRQFLKDFMLTFACWIYSWRGKYYVIERSAGASQAINNTYIIEPLQKIENANPIEYVQVKGSINWNARSGPSLWSPEYDNYEHSYDAGDDAVLSSRQFVWDGSGLMPFIYILYGSSGDYPSPAQNPTSVSSAIDPAWLEDTTLTSPPNNFFDENIETGMLVYYHTNVGTSWDTIVNVEAVKIWFKNPKSWTPITTNTYFIRKDMGETGRTQYLYKIDAICKYARDVYNEFYLTSADIFKVKLRDISAHDYIHRRFTMFGNSYRIKSAMINFKNDYLDFELVQVA